MLNKFLSNVLAEPALSYFQVIFAEARDCPDCLKRSELAIDLARLLTDDRPMCASDCDSTCSDIRPSDPAKTKVFDDLR